MAESGHARCAAIAEAVSGRDTNRVQLSRASSRSTTNATASTSNSGNASNASQLNAPAAPAEPPSPAKSNTTERSSPKPAPIVPTSSPNEQSTRSTPLAQQNTMVSDKLDSTEQFSSTRATAERVRKGLVNECAGKFAGPMKVDGFLRRYVPEPPQKAGEMPSVSWKSVLDARRESEMYQPFVRRLSLCLSHVSYVLNSLCTARHMRAT